MKKSNTNEFIQKANIVHENKYSYDKVLYQNSKTKVCITCCDHGEFWQTPHDHLLGCGCPKCKSIKISQSKVKNKDYFINNSILKHGIKYDYLNVDYVNGKTKVCIICPEHGEFWQTPQDHLSGRGCPKCSGKKFNTDDFILKSQKIHNNKYDYSKVVYKNALDKVCIICPQHGEFWQIAQVHLRNHGCPKCGQLNSLNFTISKGEKSIMSFLKEYNINFISQYPIRCSINLLGVAYIDFYLPDYNIFIEYNGKQHYEHIPYFCSVIDFEKQKKRDLLVKEYCKINDIELIEISYKNHDYIDFLKQKFKLI